MEPKDLNLLISNIGLIQQTAAAILLAVLFLLLNSNKKLATWQLFQSWFWLSISLVALVLQYSSVLNLNILNDLSDFGKIIVNGFYLVGKGLFFIFLFCAIRSLCDIPENQYQLKRQHLIWTWLTISLAAVLITKNLNHYVLLQAPLAIFLLIRSGQLLTRYYPGVGIGRKIVPAIIYLNMVLWVLYFISFPKFMGDFLEVNGYHLRKLLSFNSYADLLGQMLLAFGMLIVIFEKYSKILQMANGQLEQLNSSLKKQSYLDALTGSQNRRALEFHFKNMNFANNKGSTMVVCDLDNLKGINDSLGHSYGDQLLITFVEYIKRSLREGDNIYRIGGDEFVIWMQNCSFVLANNRFKSLLAKVPDIENQSNGLKLSFSYGCAAILPETPLEDIIAEADQLMYQKKQQHKKISSVEKN